MCMKMKATGIVLPPPLFPVCPSDAPTVSSSWKLMFSLDWLCCLDATKGGKSVLGV